MVRGGIFKVKPEKQEVVCHCSILRLSVTFDSELEGGNKFVLN